MKKTIGVILILLSAPGFYFFIDYLIFEFKGHGDDGPGSYAIWAGGMIGLASGLVLLAIGLIIIVSAKKKYINHENNSQHFNPFWIVYNICTTKRRCRAG